MLYGISEDMNVCQYRYEYKYILNRIQEEILFIKASGILELDSHAKEEGIYRVHSLYFDDYQDICFAENEAGTDPRSKFRIRYYNNNPEQMCLEKKSKLKSMVRKESCPLDMKEYEAIVSGNALEVINGKTTLKQKMISELYLRSLIPKVIVSYERIPFIYEGGNVRITFDSKIMSSGDTTCFLTGNYISRPIFSQEMSIFEVKWDNVLPLHIKTVLQMNSLQRISFSKYYMSRKYCL